MKKLFLLLFAMVAFGAVAQNPSFKSFDTNYFTTNNLIIRVKTNNNSTLIQVVSNQINIQISQSLTNGVSEGDSFWRTNALFVNGGITNVFGPVWIGGHGSQGQVFNEFWLGTNGIPGEPWVRFDGPDWGTHFGYNTYLEFEITESGSLDGQMFWIENFPGEWQGQATFGSEDPYSTNMFQVVTDTNGIPAFEIGLYSVASNVRINNPLTVKTVQTNLAQAGTGVRIAVFDPAGKLYAGFATNAIGSTNVGGSGFVLEYTTTDPTTDNVFPTSSNSPAIAYKRGGLGSTYVWNTVTFIWD